MVLSLNYYFSTAVFTVADILPHVMLNSQQHFYYYYACSFDLISFEVVCHTAGRFKMN